MLIGRDIETFRKALREGMGNRQYPFSPATVEEISVEDLVFLTEYFQFEPLFWSGVFHEINRHFIKRESLKVAQKKIDETYQHLPRVVSLVPVFLMVAEAYTVM